MDPFQFVLCFKFSGIAYTLYKLTLKCPYFNNILNKRKQKKIDRIPIKSLNYYDVLNLNFSHIHISAFVTIDVHRNRVRLKTFLKMVNFILFAYLIQNGENYAEKAWQCLRRRVLNRIMRRMKMKVL